MSKDCIGSCKCQNCKDIVSFRGVVVPKNPFLAKPICVCISDIHFNINNLELATTALKAAIFKAEELKIPLVIAGDLQDTKAIIRAEVANRLIELIRDAKTKIYILVGNHDLINEKGTENALNYLAPYATIISKPTFEKISGRECFLVPYQTDPEILEQAKSFYTVLIIMHQGVLGAEMGDYIQDKTSIAPEFKCPVISGHYHRHQTIGTITYIGSPFTHTFGESGDGDKGFLVLNSDGTFTREILNLRRHRKFNVTSRQIPVKYGPNSHPDDLIWLKVSGPKSELIKLDKKVIGDRLLGHSNFKLDLIPTDSKPTDLKIECLPTDEIFDSLIDNLSETDDQKAYLKETWRAIIEGSSK